MILSQCRQGSSESRKAYRRSVATRVLVKYPWTARNISVQVKIIGSKEFRMIMALVRISILASAIFQLPVPAVQAQEIIEVRLPTVTYRSEIQVTGPQHVKTRNTTFSVTRSIVSGGLLRIDARDSPQSSPKFVAVVGTDQAAVLAARDATSPPMTPSTTYKYRGRWLCPPCGATTPESAIWNHNLPGITIIPRYAPKSIWIWDPPKDRPELQMIYIGSGLGVENQTVVMLVPQGTQHQFPERIWQPAP